MTAVVLALSSAALFGAMTVAVRLGLLRAPDVRLGAAATAVAAFGVALAAVPFGSGAANVGDLALFAAIGTLGPGLSQLFFTLAVRDAGAARASVVVGTAPLVTVVLGVSLLDEPIVAGVVAGAALVVAGGTALAWERVRPDAFRAIGVAWAVGCMVIFSSRDTFVRWFSGETPVASSSAAAAALFGGSVVLVLAAGRANWRRAHVFVPAGICFGLSYVFLFEAYYRGRVSVVSPLIATETLWGVALSALLIGHSERVGRRLLLGAALIVAGAALIGATR